MTDCGLCRGAGYFEDNTACQACMGDGTSQHPPDSMYAIEVRLIEIKILWVYGESPSEAFESAKKSGDLYEHFESGRSVDGWWEVADPQHDIYLDAPHVGPVEMCDCNDHPVISQTLGGYAHSRECYRHPRHGQVAA